MTGQAARNDLEERALAVFRESFHIYAAECLKIKDKGGRVVPLTFNRAQLYIHSRLEKQRKELGRVRAIILKGRQQGASTYIGGRFYHRVTTNLGQSAFIVSHEQKSTDGLYGMVKRYHEHNPLGPSTGATNAKELVFDRLDGGYKLATAGSQDVGRGNTAQLLHGSEVAFWANAATHLAGIGNTIADEFGTEIILESTANGVGNTFHQLWQTAEAAQSEYIAIFVPWFWQPEYRSAVPADFELTKEEAEYAAAYQLSNEQMAWRRNKIVTYGTGFEWLFDQEYPAIPSLAFRSATSDPLIPPNFVAASMNSRFYEERGPLVIGCDPAEMGGDRTAFVFRRGRVVFRVEAHERKSPMEVAGMLAKHWRDMQPDAIFIDRIGIGAGIYDRLLELNIPAIGVHSGEAARERDIYANKRAEMWWDMRMWLEHTPNRIPPDPALMTDLSAPSYTFDSTGRRLVEKKEKMRARGVRSPDLADALALTFAEPVVPRMNRDTYTHTAADGYMPASSAGY